MKREKIYNYFYIVNNLLNGRFYLGVHSTDTLADGYFGSGLALKKAIKSYGKENFELTPLKFFKTRKELMDFEREIVNERFLTYYKGICYNLKKGGGGGSVKRFTTEELEEHKQEYNQSQKGKETHRKYDQSQKGKETQRRFREQNPDYMQEYNQRPEAKERGRERDQRPERKEYRREYNQSQKGKETQRRYRAKKKAAKLASQSTPVVNK